MIALRATRILAALAASQLLVSTALCQKSETEIQAEIEFARGLAADWGFVDLAESVIEEVRSEGVTGRMNERLGLVTCEVYAIGARNERDPLRRNELFDKALGAYTSFIEENPYSDETASAEAAFVDTSAMYAGAIAIALEDAVGEEAATLKARQDQILTEAVKKTQDLIAALRGIETDDRSELQTRELYTLMLNRGRMLASIGQNQPENTFFFEEAIKALEDLVFEAGEGTPYALRAYVAMGETYAGKKHFSDASDYYTGVIEQTLPTDPEEWKRVLEENGGTIPAAQMQLRYLFLELAIAGLMEAYTSIGDTAEACRYALHYYNIQRREGITFSPQGYVSLLAAAKALLDSSGYIGGNTTAGEAMWYATEDEMKEEHKGRRQQTDCTSFALQVAQTVRDENRGNVLQVRAQKLISEISNQPGVVVSPEIAFDAAQGDYYEGNFEDALEGFRRVLRSLDSAEQTERALYGAKVMNHVANCYRKMDRPLESAMAFREGVSAWTDPEFDALNAKGYHNQIKVASRGALVDADVFERLITEAEQFVAQKGSESSQDQIFYQQGEKAYRKKEWADAAAKYQQIQAGADNWEKALVKIGVCQYRLSRDNSDAGAEERALEAFVNYLTEVRTDPTRATTSPVLLANRKEASATAEFYRGLIQFDRAAKASERELIAPGDELSAGTLALYAEIDANLANFHETYKEQDKLANWTMHMVMQARLALGNRETARAILETMTAAFPDSSRTGQASTQFYYALSRLRSSLDPTTGEYAQLTREMADRLATGNAAAASPKFANLRTEMVLWKELSEWENVEAAAMRIVAKFGDDEDNAVNMVRYVYPDLGEALLEQQRVADAKEILTPIVMDPPTIAGQLIKPSKKTILNWSRSITGWLVGDGVDIQVIAGAGGDESEWQLAINKIDAISKAGEKWTSCEWYEQRLMVAFGYWAWGQEDSRKIDSAKNRMQELTSGLEEPDFAQVNQFCELPDTPAEFSTRLGGGVLQGRLRWLARQLR